jgi:hypothetical protein
MRPRRIVPVVLTLLTVLCSPVGAGAAPALDGSVPVLGGATVRTTSDARAPRAATITATAVTNGNATLLGTVDPNGSATSYRFEWGETTAYGDSVPAVDAPVASDHAVHDVVQRLGGLAPGTTYHFRLVATNRAGVGYGADRTFTTPGAPAAAPAEPGTAPAPADQPAPPAPAPGDPSAAPAPAPADEPAPPAPAPAPAATDPAPASGSTPSSGQPAPAAPSTTLPLLAAEGPQPRLGHTAVAQVSSGTIRFRAPGRSNLTVLRGDRAIPSGSIVDARRGTLVLESALDRRGRTQRASFRGARFKMSLSRRDRGMVDIRLKERPPVCHSRSAVVAGAARVHRRRRARLWAKDRHGKYRTHGRNSVAIVRGTEWTTEETCSGTVTRVRRGAVQVRDLHTGKRILVRAGHAYRARPAK